MSQNQIGWGYITNYKKDRKIPVKYFKTNSNTLKRERNLSIKYLVCNFMPSQAEAIYFPI